MIPADWKTERLADLADYKAGRTPARARSEYWKEVDDAVPWVAISDMTEYGTVTQTKEKISKTAFERVFRNTIVPTGTLIMSFKLTIGRVATLGVDACHNEAIISIYPREGVDQRFLSYFLSQVDYAALQDRQVKGNTLNREKIDRIKVWCPPLDEQIEIADVLDLLRRAIWLEAEALNTVQDLKHAAMQELFTKGLCGEAQKETEIGPIPESWELKTILELCEIRSGGTPRKSVPEYWEGTIPWVSGKDLKRPSLNDSIDHISEKGADTGSRIAPAESVLILVRGMGLAKDLPVTVIDRPMAFNQDIKALVPKDRFSGGYLRSAIYVSKQRLLNKIVASAHGTMTLNLNDIETFVVPCPESDDEAKEIVTILDTIDRKIDLHRRKRIVLDDLFKSLLHRLMTGEIRTADLDLSSFPDLGQMPHGNRSNHHEA